jgi:hypothetical protein
MVTIVPLPAIALVSCVGQRMPSCHKTAFVAEGGQHGMLEPQDEEISSLL